MACASGGRRLSSRTLISPNSTLSDGGANERRSAGEIPAREHERRAGPALEELGLLPRFAHPTHGGRGPGGDGGARRARAVRAEVDERERGARDDDHGEPHEERAHGGEQRAQN